MAIDAFGQHLVEHDGRARTATWPFWGTDSNTLMVEEFISAIREAREPAVTGVDGLRAVEIVDAAYRSIRTGAAVAVRTDSDGVAASQP